MPVGIRLSNKHNIRAPCARKCGKDFWTVVDKTHDFYRPTREFGLVEGKRGRGRPRISCIDNNSDVDWANGNLPFERSS